MQAKHNIDSLTVKTLTSTFIKIKVKKPNKNMYSWADRLFREGSISASLLHTLKAIISCSAIDRPTISQINVTRNRSASKKFAQDDTVTDRTIRRHVQELEKLQLIEVTRSRDERRNSRNAYVVRVPEDGVSYRSEDMMSSSLCTSDPISKINTKSDHINENFGLILKSERALTRPPRPRRAPVQEKKLLNEHQLRQLAILLSMGTWEPVAIGWLLTYDEYIINDAIQEVKMKSETNPGGYMRKILDGLDERKALQKEKSTHPITPGLIATGAFLEPFISRPKDRMVGKQVLADLKKQLGKE